MEDRSQEICDIVSELEQGLETFEGDFSNDKALCDISYQFAQLLAIAKDLKSKDLSQVTELGVNICKNAQKVQDKQLLTIIVGVLFGASEVIFKMAEQLKSGDNASLKKINPRAFLKRLKWLSEKFKESSEESLDDESDLGDMDMDFDMDID